MASAAADSDAAAVADARDSALPRAAPAPLVQTQLRGPVAQARGPGEASGPGDSDGRPRSGSGLAVAARPSPPFARWRRAAPSVSSSASRRGTELRRRPACE